MARNLLSLSLDRQPSPLPPLEGRVPPRPHSCTPEPTPTPRPPNLSLLLPTLLHILILAQTTLAPTLATASPLEQAENLLANPATARQGIATLSREMQSRDPSRAVAAAIMLAQHLRTHGETAKAVTALESYGGFAPEKLQETVLPAYLERTRCLAADARIREAVKALDFAKEKTQGHQRARVFAAYADMHGIAKEWLVAIKQYQAALAYGDKYFTRKKTKESVEVVLGPVVPGTDTWKKTHRPPIVASLRHAERQYEIASQGQTEKIENSHSPGAEEQDQSR